MTIALVTGVKLIILAGSVVALGVQRQLRTRRYRQASTLALVSSPELRRVGCQRLCVPTDTAGEAVLAPRTYFKSAPPVSPVRPMKLVGEFRSAPRRPRHAAAIAKSLRHADDGGVVIMSDRTIRVTARMPLRKM